MTCFLFAFLPVHPEARSCRLHAILSLQNRLGFRPSQSCGWPAMRWGTLFLLTLELLQTDFSAFAGELPCDASSERGCVVAWSWLMFIVTEDHVPWTFWVYLERALSKQAAVETSPAQSSSCQLPALLQQTALAALTSQQLVLVRWLEGTFPLWEAPSMLLLTLVTMKWGQTALKNCFPWSMVNFLRILSITLAKNPSNFNRPI